MKKKEQHYRVSDFENAIRKSDLNILISTVNYLPVEQNNRGIRVTWNNAGKAFVATARTPEFDINL